MKKAAMFGLDARIALAIFGALSVISGAALYSAIQQSKTISAVAGLKEIEKAVEAYLLDTGLDLPNSTVSGYTTLLAPLSLVESSVSGWQGPYLSYAKVTGKDYNLDHPNFDIIGIFFSEDTDNNIGSIACTDRDCEYVISIKGVPADLMKNMDVYMDGAEDADSGNFRYNATHTYYYTGIHKQ